MLGLGETRGQVEEALRDLRAHEVDMITIGQYLQPTRTHMPVVDYIHPDQFATYREEALQKGFAKVESSPLVRSSYHAEKHIIPKKIEGKQITGPQI